MGLREQAAADARAILEDAAAGFGWPITVRDPEQRTAELVGFSNDIHQTIDPQTGMVVSGRLASVALSVAALTEAGFTTLPKSVAETSRFPWVVRFNDLSGRRHTFKVREANPDRGLGIITCTLEAYSGAGEDPESD
jgi:hypothetical protein